jgi:serine/threonine protein kinase
MARSALELVLRQRLAYGPATEVWRAAAAAKPGRVLVAKRWIDRPEVSAAAHRVHRVAITLEGLAHPNVMPVLGVGTVGNDLWMLTPFASGGSLRGTLDPSTPTQHAAPDVARLGATLASALAALHRAGIVHGGVHAGNVLFDARGVPQLGDVGVSLRTPPSVDAREDVRALARLLDALLRRAEAMPSRTQAPPDAVLTATRASSALQRTIVRTSQPEPTGRVPTASAFASTLDDVLSQLRADARRASSDHGDEPQPRSAWQAGHRPHRPVVGAPPVTAERADAAPLAARASAFVGRALSGRRRDAVDPHPGGHLSVSVARVPAHLSTAGPASCSCLQLPCVE